LACERLVAWTIGELGELATIGNHAARLAADSAGNGHAERLLLHDQLQRRRADQMKIILGALGRLAPSGTIQLVERGLRSEVRELQTQALEALETLGEPRIVRGFIPLLEGKPELENLPGLEQVLEHLNGDADPWMRAFALRLQLNRLRGQLEDLREKVEKDPSEIVQRAWEEATEIEGVGMSRTLDTMTTMERILYLRQIPIFDDLDPEDLHRIADATGERVIPDRAYLCREGEISDELFLIVEGEVAITKQDNGGQKEVRRLGTGQPVGELAILAQQPRSANVQALGGSVRVLVIGGRGFQAILRDRPQVSSALLANLARRLSTMA
jgi:hypothetical protein